MKKLVSLALSLSLMAALVACSGSSSSTGTATSSNTGGAAAGTGETTATDKLTVWCWDPAFNMYAMEAAGQIYAASHEGFELEIVETPWEDVQTKITTIVTSGALDGLPDIILMQDNAFQKNATNYPDLFYDLTDSGIDFTEFASAKVEYSVLDGKNYGVPFDNGTAITCLRTDVLEQAGLTTADFTDISWERFIELGEQVLAETGMPLLSVVAGESDLPMMMMQSAGSSLFNTDKTPNISGNEVVVEMAGIYTELISKGICILVNNWDEYVSTLTNGTVAGTVNGCWILASIQTATDQSGNWSVTNIPAMDIGEATNYSNNGGSSWGVIASSANTELAVDFLKETFAGSVELYEQILPASGAMATYLPAGDSAVYAEPQEFFGGQSIYADITEYASHVPSVPTGVYYYEARDALATALTNVVNGADLTSELGNAQNTVEFQMGA